MIAKIFTDSFVEVQKLVENFHRHIDEYLKPKYQEAEVRQDFLDKFFVALGWDVYHHENSNPYEREVRIEKSVMVQGRGKRADYAFYTAPNFTQARFMAEAKKPSKQLENAQDCFQAIRYGWNSNTPISVLTDFEQFLVLDSRYKPTIETATQRIIREKSYKYTDYADEEKFREIYYLFSREAVFNNSLETFAKSLKGGRGAKQSKLFNTSIIQPMDEEFLSELDEQRVVLAKGFKNRNSELDGETLTEITQRTLDRLVFLRFLEDKLVEPDSVIDNLGKKSGSAWRDFIGEMPRLNQTYNGTLFKKHSLLDNPTFAPDERAFENTRDWLSHFNSPYDFNSIPIHILGSIYERFLGKTIVATDKRATVEDKPEVRKAGGVYYTPEYIVRYIVENTVGKLIEKKKPEEIAEMRFADIACGSGSFLLGVFDYLIAYHVEWFSENKTRREKAVKDGLCRETIEGVLQLTIHYKREILTNNIYGVDLDAQAVEVAQLSLYLKLLEEETTATKQQFLSGFREQLLPSLGENIVHGNSLIDYDIDSGLFDFKDFKKLNPMSFEGIFKGVFDEGGFDAIVGNPPYSLVGTDRPYEQEYYKDNYSLTTYKINTYILFLEKGLKLLKTNVGTLGFIIPKSLVFNTYFSAVRNKLLCNYLIPQIVEIRDKVFVAAEVGDSILFFASTDDNPSGNDLMYYKVTNIAPSFEILETHQTPQDILSEREDSFFYLAGFETKATTKPLSEFAFISNGLNPGNVRHILLSKSPETSEHQKMLLGRDIQKYNLNWSGTWVNYNPKLKNQIKISDIKSKKGMTPQTKIDFALRNPKIYASEKILVRKTADHLIATFDSFGFYFDSLSYGIQLKPDIKESILYLLGILNSQYLNSIHNGISQNKEKIFAKVLAVNLGKLPIRTIDFSDPDEKMMHDEIVGLVKKILETKKSLADAQTDKDQNFYKRFCASLNRRIDDLVYDLYDLTADERRIIESS